MFVVLSVIPEIAGLLNSSLLHFSIIPEALDINKYAEEDGVTV
jgi:hypothetical protein